VALAQGQERRLDFHRPPQRQETMGDYCSVPIHVLPTGGHARARSGLLARRLQQRITVQETALRACVETRTGCRNGWPDSKTRRATPNAVSVRLRAPRCGSRNMNPLAGGARPEDPGARSLRPCGPENRRLERLHAMRIPGAPRRQPVPRSQPLSGASAAEMPSSPARRRSMTSHRRLLSARSD